jgi:hypothetical protein
VHAVEHPLYCRNGRGNIDLSTVVTREPRGGTMAGERAVERALAAWRDAERGLAQAVPGTPDYIRAAMAVDEARCAYASITAERYEELGQSDGPHGEVTVSEDARVSRSRT